ncbi:hypothetical protein BJP36_10055 [Moorena producens JHB]|uniref:Uncharacterized protein n=1 Tax=Moorena producens (strain JHB) TaxID=1454205 RepID=A0A1D9FXW4_MOOP1|nr:hypothetical protein [Moorena producens]AOY80212.2 hypothetical protein BJP36_10055 [Moorena producens JHB]
MPIPQVRPKGDLLALGSHLSAKPTRGANAGRERVASEESASCCGTGIKPVSIYCRGGRMGHQGWNWHQASFNILSGGQDAHSTPIQRED